MIVGLAFGINVASAFGVVLDVPVVRLLKGISIFYCHVRDAEMAFPATIYDCMTITFLSPYMTMTTRVGIHRHKTTITYVRCFK